VKPSSTRYLQTLEAIRSGTPRTGCSTELRPQRCPLQSRRQWWDRMSLLRVPASPSSAPGGSRLHRQPETSTLEATSHAGDVVDGGRRRGHVSAEATWSCGPQAYSVAAAGRRVDAQAVGDQSRLVWACVRSWVGADCQCQRVSRLHYDWQHRRSFDSSRLPARRLATSHPTPPVSMPPNLCSLAVVRS
jgi:hypothetical protein